MSQNRLIPIIPKRIHFGMVCLCFLVNHLQAQQLPLLSQFGEYQGVLNPSTVQYDHYFSGYEWSFASSYRDQWTMIPNGPSTQLLTATYLTNTTNKFDLLFGGSIINDKVGHFATTEIYARVASVYNFSRFYSRHNKGGISIGLLAGAIQYRLDTEALRSADGSEDPRLAQGLTSIRPDLGIGVSIYKLLKRGKWKDYIYGGLAISQLQPNTITYTSIDDTAFSFRRIAHFNLNASYYLSTGDYSNVEFTLWVRAVRNIPPSASLIVKYKFSEWLWIGVGYSTQQIAHLEAGLNIDTYRNKYRGFKLVFSFNPINPNYLAEFGSTYELTLKYLLNNE